MTLKKNRTVKKSDKRTIPPDNSKHQEVHLPEIAVNLDRVEFHRHGLALVPDETERRPGVAYLITGDKRLVEQHFCSCSMSTRQTCPHIQKLSRSLATLIRSFGGRSPREAFESSNWHRLGVLLAQDSRETVASVKVRFLQKDSSRQIRIYGADESEKTVYLSQGPDAERLLERFGQVPADDGVPNRAALLKRLGELTLSENELAMDRMGYKSMGQVLAEKFWYRLAYHLFREFPDQAIILSPAVEEATGRFILIGKGPDEVPLFHLILPREKVRAVLRNFQDQLLNQNKLALSPVPLKSIFKISATTEMDLEIRPMIEILQTDGEKKFLEREELEKYRYGDLIYVKELGLLAELERPGPERKFTAPIKMVLKKSQVPEFLQENVSLLKDEAQLVDASVKNLKIFSQAETLEILPEAIHRDWCWLDVRYGFGKSLVSLRDILETRREGQRYLAVDEGWVDCRTPEWGELSFLEKSGPEFGGEGLEGKFKLSFLELLRLQALHPAAWQVSTRGAPGRRLSQILNLKPTQPFQPLKGLRSSLRPYQILGVDWLSFIWENRLGGLLCDDMGLGKTHQVMALLVKLRELEKVRGPFLVVCPTTVLSHWVRKIAAHTRGLKTVVYHGGGRELGDALKKKPILLTTYGILRNDIDSLKEVPFAVAVFDEIQNLKNAGTQSHQAARQVTAEVKIGLTGTPIENRVDELKALLDLTVPGYLGSDETFAERYVKPLETDPRGCAGERLTRLITPFTLRRLKKTVLLELPEKIEDLRFCELSEDQLALYRQAIATQGKELRRALREKKKTIPYIHIFALLTLLKRICDHPAVALKKAEGYKNYGSGKWDLFQELLAEGLESGQKIVVYSQFLDMLRIMERHLQETGTGFVTLTGASTRRGEIIDRFYNDPQCRVFLGSLKAGGTGIDLVAASVVIHYDRWWNAAREDQATDRVHRIGQQRGVQVFKLVTAGTLEEKISAIIEKKKNLMETIVQEDDPNLLKTFTREELLELIS